MTQGLLYVLPVRGSLGTSERNNGDAIAPFVFILPHGTLHKRQRSCGLLHALVMSGGLNLNIETKSVLKNGEDAREIVHCRIALRG